jgi:hypothetical protein
VGVDAGSSCIKKMELFDFITKSDKGLGTYDGVPGGEGEDEHVKNTFEIIDDVFSCLEKADMGEDPVATSQEFVEGMLVNPLIFDELLTATPLAPVHHKMTVEPLREHMSQALITYLEGANRKGKIDDSHLAGLDLNQRRPERGPW